jgi:hypothetical protein
MFPAPDAESIRQKYVIVDVPEVDAGNVIAFAFDFDAVVVPVAAGQFVELFVIATLAYDPYAASPVVTPVDVSSRAAVHNAA